MSTLEEPWWPLTFRMSDGEPEATWHADDVMIGGNKYSVMRHDENLNDGDLYTVFQCFDDAPNKHDHSVMIDRKIDGLLELRCFLLELAYPGSKS